MSGEGWPGRLQPTLRQLQTRPRDAELPLPADPIGYRIDSRATVSSHVPSSHRCARPQKGSGCITAEADSRSSPVPVRYRAYPDRHIARCSVSVLACGWLLEDMHPDAPSSRFHRQRQSVAATREARGVGQGGQICREHVEGRHPHPKEPSALFVKQFRNVIIDDRPDHVLDRFGKRCHQKGIPVLGWPQDQPIESVGHLAQYTVRQTCEVQDGTTISPEKGRDCGGGGMRSRAGANVHPFF